MSTSQYALDVATAAALLGGRLIRDSFLENSSLAANWKSSFADVVTETDRLVDARVRELLEKSFREATVRSEESGGEANAHEFIVDPIDGSLNFSHGDREVAISIGYWEKGVPLAGVVYNPLQDRLYQGIKGGGAFLNGTRIAISETSELNDSLLGSGWPYDKDSVAAAGKTITEIANVCQEVRLSGSSALAVCKVADGSLDGFWEAGLFPWDLAAAVLILREAGGVFTSLSGRQFNLEKGEILATNGKIHEKLMERL